MNIFKKTAKIFIFLQNIE